MYALFFALCSGSTAVLSAAEAEHSNLDRPISMGELTPTPEMWFYQQETKSYRDPKLAVRHKAEYRAAQREMRLAAQKWYGVHPSRPTSSTTPFQGETSAARFGGGRDPNLWPGTVSPTVILQSRRDNYRNNW